MWEGVAPEELVARGDAPVKPKFRRRMVRVHVPAVTRSRPAAAPPPAEGGSTGAGGETAPQRKSKTQMKKERAQQRASAADLCTAHALGRCKRGAACCSNHDVAVYLAAKPPAPPGTCPFAASPECPYGITCCWAVRHGAWDALSAQHMEELRARQAAAEPAAAEANDAGAEANGAGAEAAGGPQPAAPEPAGDDWWWRRDGTLPAAQVALPTPTDPHQAPLNTLPKGVQIALRKREYDFGRADGVLRSMGIHISKQQAKHSQRGKHSKGGNNGAAAAGPPPAKRARAEDGGAAPAAGAADAEAQKSGSDADFLASVGAPAEPPAEAAAANAAPTAAPAAAAAAPPATERPHGGASDAADLAAHPREKKGIDFRGKLFLAPLTTVGNLPFRRLCKRLGADVTCGEMALATNLLQGQSSEWALLKRHPEEDLFGVQVCGGYADSMARCAQLVEDTCRVDFVDVNFGCPIDIICGRGAGAACLQRPARMEQVVRSMRAVLSCPLTIKLRKGYSDGADVAHELLPHAAEWGAAAATLHGRTREQRYSRLADWPYIRRCSDAVAGTGLQLIGNGDVCSFEDHYRHLEEGGVATTYIARGALIKPWIFTEIKERRHWDISAGERLDLLKRFCSMGLDHWGSDNRGVEATRRFLLEWLSFQWRYIPVGLLDVLPQRMHWQPPGFVGRSDLETLLASDHASDWVLLSEMLLGPAPPGYTFQPKHKASSYARRPGAPPPPPGGGGAGMEEGQENG